MLSIISTWSTNLEEINVFCRDGEFTTCINTAADLRLFHFTSFSSSNMRLVVAGGIYIIKYQSKCNYS